MMVPTSGLSIGLRLARLIVSDWYPGSLARKSQRMNALSLPPERGPEPVVVVDCCAGSVAAGCCCESAVVVCAPPADGGGPMATAGRPKEPSANPTLAS
jgi:hypothetical protein